MRTKTNINGKSRRENRLAASAKPRKAAPPAAEEAGADDERLLAWAKLLKAYAEFRERMLQAHDDGLIEMDHGTEQNLNWVLEALLNDMPGNSGKRAFDMGDGF